MFQFARVELLRVSALSRLSSFTLRSRWRADAACASICRQGGQGGQHQGGQQPGQGGQQGGGGQQNPGQPSPDAKAAIY
jgi:hypothetical protein